MRQGLTVAAALAMAWGASVEAVGPTVDLPGLGALQGVDMAPTQGVTVRAFQGVPYAAPPTNAMRWQPPGEPQAWAGVRNATAYGNTCMGSQCKTRAGILAPSKDSEDCLFLNVYTPVTTDAAGGRGPFPIMFWIHGGAFDFGCSNEYDGAQLAASSAAQGQPVVVVTINYRLGVFGFLASEEMRAGNKSISIGNYGIMDQRKAMEFVQAYGGKFNGDVSRITIFGESAGAGSVTNHLVQKASFGLYQNAIAQSGFAPTWSSKPISNAETYYKQVTDYTGCDSFACLRGLSADRIMLAHALIPALPTDRFIGWAPVVDGVALTEDPETLLRKGQFPAGVNILKGTNRDEYALFLPLHLIFYDATEQQFDDLVTGYIPTNDADQWLAEVKQLYSDAEYASYPKTNALNATHYYWAVTRALTDHEFYCPGRRAGRALAGDDSVHVFTYHLRHSNDYGAALVPHTADIPYVFNCSGAGKATPEQASTCGFDSAVQGDLAAMTSRYWVQFATTNTLPSPWTEQGCKDPDTMLVLDVPENQGGGGVFLTSQYSVPQCEFWDRVLAAQNGDPTAQPFQPRPIAPLPLCK